MSFLPVATRVHGVMGVPIEIIDAYAEQVLASPPVEEFTISGYRSEDVRAAAELWARYRKGDLDG